MHAEKKLLMLPVRRKLMAVSAAYLSGIFLAQLITVPVHIVGIFSMLFFVWGALRLLRRKSVLFCLLAILLLFGNFRAGTELSRRDAPTAPGTQIEGRISRIEKPYRVYLTDVSIDGCEAGFYRDAVVTLMLDDRAAAPDEPRVGQIITGEGRLFAPDEKRNPGGTDWRIQTIVKGYELSGYLLPGWQAEGNAVFSLRECMRNMRARISERIGRLFGDQAALFRGIMLGDRSDLDQEITAAMRLTGTAHILTVSGLHLSMVAGVVSALLGHAPIGRKRCFVLLSGFLILFTGITGAAAGTVRACIMAMMREGARMRGRRYEPLTALSFAALCMTLVKPLWLLSASFQFSFFVVLSIQLFSNMLSAFFARHVRGVLLQCANLVSVSLSAQLGSVPMQLMLYGYLPVLSLPMNLLCAAIMPALLLGGWLSVLVSVVSMDAAALMAGALAWIAGGFERVSLYVAALHGAVIRLPAPYGVTVLLALVLFLLLTTRIRYGRLKWPAELAIAILMLGSYAIRFDPGPRYVQLDVGQGDAALFRSGRKAVLVDVGPTDSYEMLRYLRHEGLYVDAVILSHLDEDHAGALGVLFSSEVSIPAVIMAEGAQTEENTAEVQSVIAQLKQRGIALHEVARGDRIDVLGISMDVLSPDDRLAGSNERSLLLHANMEGVSFLLAGDLTMDSEPAFVPEVDVLKVAHHGSKNSTSDAFAAMASPRVAIISVGEGNWYGHPHARVLDLLRDTRILRTDRHGCITLYLRDGEFDEKCFLDP